MPRQDENGAFKEMVSHSILPSSNGRLDGNLKFYRIPDSFFTVFYPRPVFGYHRDAPILSRRDSLGAAAGQAAAVELIISDGR